MKQRYFYLIIAVFFMLGFLHHVSAQNLAQEAYAIFEQSCLICHGENGSYKESLIIEHNALIDDEKIIPGDPDGSVFYQRLIETNIAKRMPLGQPPLAPAAIETIRQWIAAGAPDWNTPTRPNTDFITTQAMLETIEIHVQSLAPFDRAFARYFTASHLYNAGETDEALKAYQRALSKLVNSLSWGREIIKPKAIDPIETIFYIDLRDYQWEVGTNRWTQIERIYPYTDEYNAPAETALNEKLISLQETLNCKVPVIHVDWFIANAALPPLYHDILELPLTERELQEKLEVSVTENIQNAPGKRVWRAGFNNSGVSNHNRVVERHTSQHGAYWKSYDFAGSVDTQNIFTNPLSFEHDGSEIIFNLPNGLQAYYLANQNGNRLNVAPTDIVSNPAVSEPAVRNGLSCIGCHTEGMKTFEDEVRNVVEQNANPPYDKARALSLYVEKATMDALVAQDTERYRQALEKTGDVFGGIEPIQRFHEVFQGSIDAKHAAASLGLGTEILLKEIQQNVGLQNLGLLVLENGTIKRDTWTRQYTAIVHALDFPQESITEPVEPITERIPGTIVNFPDHNMHRAIEEALGKSSDAQITVDDMATLTSLVATYKQIQNLEGIQFATGLKQLDLRNGNTYNNILDISPLAGLTQLTHLNLDQNNISDISPLAGLTQLQHLYIREDRKDSLATYDNNISDITPLAGLTQLQILWISGNNISDLSPLTGLTQLTSLSLGRNNITNVSPLAGLTELTDLNLDGNNISDFSPLVGLTKLETLRFDIAYENMSTLPDSIAKLQTSLYFSQHYRAGLPPISDLSPLAKFTGLRFLYLGGNNISDLSPLSGLTELIALGLNDNNISNLSPLTGLTKLEDLLLNNNNISDITPLTELTKLWTLDLRENNITDITPLKVIREKGRNIHWHKNPGFREDGIPIEASWLWVVVPQTGNWRNRDGLALASDNAVTELGIATNGTREGSSVGDYVWTTHKMPIDGHQRLGPQLASMGMEGSDNLSKIVYGCTFVDSPLAQETTLFVPDSYALKVWINGVLLSHTWRISGGPNPTYVDFYSVKLKAGRNVLLFGSIGGNSDLPGFAHDTEYTASIPGVNYTLSKTPINGGDTFTLDLSARNVIDLADWRFDISFDPTVLEVLEVNERDFMKQNGGSTLFQKGTIDNTAGKIEGLSSSILTDTGVNGTGVLLSVTFKAKTEVETQVALHNFQLLTFSEEVIPAGPHQFIFAITPKEERLVGDVNEDGQVNVRDLILVSRSFGKDASDNPQADVNQDGIINIQDLILVATHIGESTDTNAAPTILTMENIELTPAVVQTWIDQAKLEDDGSLVFRQGIENLEKLLTSLIPEKTALLANYPNPFNPETWIPYQLAVPADVTLTIYAIDGSVVRTLALGHQLPGIYQNRSRAAHWDGKNALGEPVASGLYFYTLTADDFTATRKLLIRK